MKKLISLLLLASILICPLISCNQIPVEKYIPEAITETSDNTLETTVEYTEEIRLDESSSGNIEIDDHFDSSFDYYADVFCAISMEMLVEKIGDAPKNVFTKAILDSDFDLDLSEFGFDILDIEQDLGKNYDESYNGNDAFEVEYWSPDNKYGIGPLDINNLLIIGCCIKKQPPKNMDGNRIFKLISKDDDMSIYGTNSPMDSIRLARWEYLIFMENHGETIEIDLRIPDNSTTQEQRDIILSKVVELAKLMRSYAWSDKAN